MTAPRSVFFDLDGTLLDTAQDLHAALNRLCEEESRPLTKYADFRGLVSQGSPAMLRLGFDCEPSAPDYERLRNRLLTLYAQDICTFTTPFPGVDQLITVLEGNAIQWGIVTNKPAWLTDKLLLKLGFAANAVCVISGDTLPRRKPEPDQLLHACDLARCVPDQSVYVGDARTDITAGRSAGMSTVAAAFGYIPAHDNPAQWQADLVIDAPLQLLDWLAIPTFDGASG
jgi:2-phosphoglycolate phosphatase